MKRSIILAALAALASTGLACAAPSDSVFAPSVPPAADAIGMPVPAYAAPAPAVAAAAPVELVEARPMQFAEQPAIPQATVLILPFAQQAGEPDHTWVGSAMGDHMRTELGEAGFKVVPVAEGTQAVASADEALRIARAAGAQVVVYGTYQVVGDSVRVQGQVLDVASGLPRSDVRAGSALRDLFVTEHMLMAQIDEAVRAPAPQAAAEAGAAGDGNEPVVMAEVIRPEQIQADAAAAAAPATATAPYDDQVAAATGPVGPVDQAYVDPGPIYVDPPMGGVEPYPPYIEGDWYPGPVVYPATYYYPYYPAYTTWSGLSFSFVYSSGYCWPTYGHGHFHGFRYDHGRHVHLDRHDRRDHRDRHDVRLVDRRDDRDDRGPRFRENYENHFRYYDRDGNPRREGVLVRSAAGRDVRDSRDRGSTFRDGSSSLDAARAREARTTTSLLGSRGDSPVLTDRTDRSLRVTERSDRSDRAERTSFRDSRPQVTRIEPRPTATPAPTAARSTPTPTPTRSSSSSASERTTVIERSAATAGRTGSSFRSERSRPEPTASSSSSSRSSPAVSSPTPAPVRPTPPAAASSSSTRFRESSARVSSPTTAGRASSASVRSAPPSAVRSVPSAPTVSRQSDSGSRSSSAALRSSSSSSGGDRFRSSSSSVRSAPSSSERSAAPARSSSSSSSSRSSGSSSSSRGGGSSSSGGRSSRR